MVKRLTVVLLTLTLSLGLSVFGSDQSALAAAKEKLVIKFASVDVDDSAVGIGMTAFKNYVEKASDGAMTVELYFNGQLGGDRQSAESVLLGTLDMSVVDAGILGVYDGAFNILAMPYAFESKDAVYRAMDGELGRVLSERAQKAGFYIWTYTDAGTRHIANSKRPINTLADLKGLKMRVPEVTITLDFMSAFGCNPTPINFSETYTSLQQGVVDGMENPIELLYTSKFMEVMTYLTLTAHSETVIPLITSIEFERKLTPEQRRIIAEGAAAQQKANRESIAKSETEYLKEMKAQGKQVIELTPEAKEGFINAVKPVYKKYEKAIGQDIIDLAHSFNP